MRWLLVLPLLLIACDSQSAGTPTFGDEYRVLTDTEPVLDRQNVLRVQVQYSGGCEEHTFDARYRQTEQAVEIWLVHDANGDLCEALVTETLAVYVDLPSDRVPPVLLTPAGDTLAVSQEREP